ncbi:conserved hypothetical protein [Virus Rctr197k]|nr:conserved hypothetical protein [Virus Rctr197k]
MADVVTFDPVTRVITEIAAGVINTINAQEIYSEWKDWLRTADNAKYPFAFTYVGGDPITLTVSVGSTFFLENGWRIRPAELSHKLTVVGNIYTREPGESIFLPTLAPFTVLAETQVSALSTVNATKEWAWWGG